jgi:FtsH-binding integral membrane protein
MKSIAIFLIFVLVGSILSSIIMAFLQGNDVREIVWLQLIVTTLAVGFIAITAAILSLKEKKPKEEG